MNQKVLKTGIPSDPAKEKMTLANSHHSRLECTNSINLTADSATVTALFRENVVLSSSKRLTDAVARREAIAVAFDRAAPAEVAG